MSKITTKFVRHKDTERRIASAKAAIRAILAAGLYETHLRQLLKICIWKLSEAEGRSKYKTLYQSVASRGKPLTQLHHEHVFEMHKLVNDLLAHPRQIDKIAAKAIACVVTRKEHERLTKVSRRHPRLTGWGRYRAAKVRVINTQTGREVRI